MKKRKLVITFEDPDVVNVDGQAKPSDLLRGIFALSSGLLAHEPHVNIEDICAELRNQFKEDKYGGRINQDHR